MRLQDEVFHIRQTQRFCTGNLDYDSMITTFPGVYILGVIWSLVLRLVSWGPAVLSGTSPLPMVRVTALSNGSSKCLAHTAIARCKKGAMWIMPYVHAQQMLLYSLQVWELPGAGAGLWDCGAADGEPAVWCGLPAALL
jgi:DIE2/ALG10 family